MSAKAPEKADQRTVAVKKTRRQLVDEPTLTTREVTGTKSYEVPARIVLQAARAHVCPQPKDADDYVLKAVNAMAEMAPQNATEAMLAVQMLATHDAALMFMRCATVLGQSTEAADGHVLRATRLMRVFNEQLEAMQKLKGKVGQQKVTVEHVHVHQGGQAIVGNVSPAKGNQGEGGG